MSPDPFATDPAATRRERLRDLRGRLWPARAAQVIRRMGCRMHPLRRTGVGERFDVPLILGVIAFIFGLFAVNLIAPYRDAVHNGFGRFDFVSLGALLGHLRAQEPVWVIWTGWMLLASGLIARGLARIRFPRAAPPRSPRTDRGPIGHYLAEVAGRLQVLPAHQRREVVRELREHLEACDRHLRFTDLRAIEARFGRARDIARGIRRAKRPLIRRLVPATRGQAAGWLAIGSACLWHAALLIEFAATLRFGVDGRALWREGVLPRVLDFIGSALARGEPLAWMLAAWVAIGAAMVVRGAVLLTRPDPGSHTGRAIR